MSGNRMQFFGVLCLVFSFNGCEARSVPVRGIANGTHGDKEVKSPEMIYVPAGKFQRDGSPSNVAEVDDFLISKYEISRELYIEVTGQGYVGRFGSIDGAPIDGVSWYDALMFCNELSVITGKTPVYSIQDENDGTYRTDQWGPIPDEASLRWDTVRIDRGASGFRLPTVDEWMWAAMGATAGKYFPMVILEREEFSDGVYRSGYMKPGALG